MSLATRKSGRFIFSKRLLNKEKYIEMSLSTRKSGSYSNDISRTIQVVINQNVISYT